MTVARLDGSWRSGTPRSSPPDVRARRRWRAQTDGFSARAGRPGAHFQVVCESDRFQDGSAGWQRALEHLNALKLCSPDAAEALDREAARFGGDWTRLHGAP